MNRACGALLTLGAAALFLSCHQARKPHESTSSASGPSSPAALRLPLDSYLSLAGLRWLAVAKPPLLFDQKSAKSSALSLLGLKAFVPLHLLERAQTDEIEELWVGGYDQGTLLVFDGRRADRVMEQNFRDEITSLAEERSPRAGLRILAGANPRSTYTLLRIDGHMIAIADGDSKLIRYTEARALGTAQTGRAALEGPLLGRLKHHFSSAPLRLFLRGPFEGASGAVTSQFVAGVAGISFADSLVTAQFVAVGVWKGAADTEKLLKAWLDRVLDTPEFRALGLSDTVSRDDLLCRLDTNFDVRGGLTACKTALSWRIDDLAEAFLRIHRAEMDELLQ